MNMREFRLLPLVMLIATCGCVSMTNLPMGSEIQMMPDEGVVLIGAPAGTKLVIHSGDLKNGKFTADGSFPEGIAGTSDDGFLVRKLRVQPAGRAYALVSVITNKRYSANCGQSLATFNVRPGGAQYITTFSITAQGSSVRIGNYTDLASAINHMKTKFPSFGKEVVQVQSAEALQDRCSTGGGTTFIPIYVPRGK